MKRIYTLLCAFTLCSLSINSIAQISFTANPSTGCTPLTVTFTNTTTQPGAFEYRWNFGDGSPMVIDYQTTTLNHTYVNKGSFYSSVEVYNSFGGYLGQFSYTITPNGLSTYDQVYIYPAEACPGQDIYINAPWGYPTYIFNYGDGVIDTLTTNSRNHKYSAPGNYPLTVKILNVCNGSDTTLSDTAFIKSTMYFSSGGGSGTGGGTYFSNYPAEACPSENISFYTGWGYATYIWNFGDGTIDTSTSANINHNYSSTGLYPTSVKIFNYCGDDTTLLDTVNVRYLPFPPTTILNITTNNSSEAIACPGEQLNFSAPWGFVYYVWNYGDGSPVDSGNVSYKNHSYTDTGVYVASVKIRQVCGNDTTLYDTVRIKNYVPFPGSIYAGAYPDPACPFKEINFYGPYGFPGYQWNWGDGTPLQTTATAYKSHTYTSGGIYNVALKVTNLCGNDTTITDSVTIDPNLPFPFGTTMTIVNGTPACPGNVNFSATSGFQYYIWNYGDGNTQTTTTSTSTHSYPTLGNYTVSVKLIDHCGKDTTISKSLAIQYQPFQSGLSFSVYDDNSCPGENIQFNGPWGYVSYNWNFGDGNTLTGSNYVNHTYSAVGQYIVTVKVKQLCGNDTTLSKIVKVINNQTFPGWVSLSNYPSTVCPGEPVNFNGPYGFANYIWNFGDGITDTTTNYYTNHKYSSGGTYSASLKVFNFCGLDTTLNITVQIDSTLNISNPMLNAWFPNGMSSCPGEMVNFNGSWGYPNYTWDFGDGSTPLSGSFNFINYSYAEAGSYTVALTIENYCGNDTTVTQTISIDGNKPIGMMPYISVSPMMMSHCPESPITFSGPSGFASYIWNFGDGTPLDSATANISNHSYSSPGNYSVSLKIINYCGNDTTTTTTVSITNTLNPYTNINIYPNPICPNQEVVLKADTGFISYYWDFGDGFSAYGSNNVNHSYTTLGNYQASVIITNYCGNSDTFFTSITVDTTTSFPSWMNLWGGWGSCPGELTTLNTQPGFSSYSWDFGDGDTITTTGSTIGHTYDQAGNYSASVTINNGCGNSTTLTSTISINSSSPINPPNIYTAQNSYCPNDGVMFLLNDWGNGSAQNYTYYWNFGDGNADTTYGIGAIHTYDSAGTYTTIVTILNQCGNSSTKIVPVNIKDNALPTLNSTIWGTLAQTGIVGCAGDAVVFYFQGTSENFWNFGDGSTGVASEEFINSKGIVTTVIKHAYSSVGTYKVALTLTNSCGNSATDTLTIQIMSDFLVDGGLILEPPMGTNSYTTCRELNFIAYGGSSYEWDFGDGGTLTTISPTVSHIYSQPGSYAVGVLITNECGYSTYFSDAINISQSGGPSADATVSVNAVCYGESTGSASVVVSGGEAPYTYLWSDELAQSGSSATGLPAGTYSVSITDALGCETDTSVVVGQAAKIDLSTSSTNTSCGGSSGAASVTIASGGNPSFAYSWSNGSVAANATNLAAGTYSVTVTDADACKAISMAAISDNGGPALVVNNITNVTCNGNNNGSVTTTASSSNSPFTYLWNTGAQTQNIASLPAGDYIVTVTDTAGCKTVEILTVSEPDNITLTFSAIGTECGEANGSAALSVSGGTPGYSYLWDSNTGSKVVATVTGLSANAYHVTVTDANSCTSVGVVTINNSNSPSLSSSKTNISCPGLSDGAINLTVSEGTTPYTFIWTWSGGSSFIEDLSGLNPGVYTVMVQDASNCWIGTSVTLTEPSFSSTMAVSDATCIGSSNGSASVTATGGASPYSYLWSNAITINSITGLAAGTFTVQITDTNNCTVNDTAIVSQPGTIAISLTGTNVSCFGGSNGTASASVTGGTSPYSYLWNNGSTSGSVSVLSAGNYYVTVSDSCGTSKIDSVTISQPAQLVSVMSKTDVSCYGGGNGTATVSVSGGTIPYNYSWNNGQTSSTAYGIFPGIHSVNVFDANGCLASNNITVNQPQPLSATAAVSNVSCYAGSDGAINLTVNGGTSPYSYNWSNGASTSSVSGLPSSVYSVTISDSCGSSVAQSVQITQPGALSLSLAVSDVKCNGANNGSLNLSASGGVSPYSYLWNTGAVSQNIASLTPGNYYVTVTDACSQSSVDSAVVAQPATLTTTISKTNVSCNGVGDGTAMVNVSGGTSAYTYNWNNGQASQTAVGLFPGNYSVNVVDVNGCLASNSVTITQPQSLAATATVSYVSCFAGSDGAINLTVIGGTSPYTYLWNTGVQTQNIASLPAGTYSVTISDSCGSSVTQTAQITEPGTLSLSLVVSDVKCNGSNNGSINLSASGGVTPYSYLWNTGVQTQNIASLTPANYYVTVTDACSQSSVDSAVVAQPATLTTTISKTNVSCNGVGDGTATVNVTGGISPYIYQWNNSQNTVTAIGLFAGFHSVNIFDANNCLASNSVVINQPQTLNVSVLASDATCGNMDAFANVMVAGGTAPYSYLWSDASVDSVAAGLGTGTVEVSVTDANGCVSSASDLIETFVPSLDICIVTVDSSNTKNLIVWEKPMVNYIDSFRIYRDIVGTYTYIGSVDYTDLSKFTDFSFGVNPSITSYRYKVSAIDTCGNESALSSLHKTMHLTTNMGTQGEANLIWDGYDGFGPANFYYRILRDSTGSGNYEVLDSVSNLNFTYSDWNVPIGTVNYLVEVVHPFGGCLATKAIENHNSSRSNRGQAANGNVLSATTTVTDASTQSSCDGTATVTATGGASPYTYLWDVAANDQATPTATGLCVGTYNVTVTDNNGNTSVTYAIIDAQVGIVENSFTENVVIYPNPGTGIFTVLGSGVQHSKIYVYNILGEIVLQSDKTGTKSEIDLRGFGSGIYSLKIISDKSIVTRRIIVE